MTVKAHTEWSVEELWQQEQGNFTAHMAIMFHYLEKHGLPLDDFIRFVGESVLPAWRRRGDTVPDVMNGILLNVRANGATVQDVRITETHAEATASSLLRPDVMERYGIAPEWGTLHPVNPGAPGGAGTIGPPWRRGSGPRAGRPHRRRRRRGRCRH